jgi:hypothetical protein
VDDLVIQRILRHSDVAVTQACYIKTVSEDAKAAMTAQPASLLKIFPASRDGGYCLHAQLLKFQHPITGEQINLEAALPSGFSLRR